LAAVGGADVHRPQCRLDLSLGSDGTASDYTTNMLLVLPLKYAIQS
jgi:hypothetical protein